MAETLEQLTDATRQKVSTLRVDSPAIVAFRLTDLGTIRVDANGFPAKVDNAAEPADTVMAMTPELYRKILEGSADATTSFMLGRIKVTGDMGVAMRVPDWLED